MNTLTLEEALYKAAAFCSAAERCAYEVEQKLIRWEVAETDLAAIMSRLYAEKYLDDARYCRAFANDKLRYNKWGRRKIHEALRMKRLPDEFIRTALQDLDPDEYNRTLKGLIKSKDRTLKADNAYERSCKLIRFAAGRGFETALICRYLPDKEAADDYETDDE